MRDDLQRMHARRRAGWNLLVLFCFILVLACACEAGIRFSDAGDEQAAAPLAQTPLFKPPSRLASEALILQPPMAFIECRVLYAAYALEQYPAQRVTTDEHRASFAPDWHEADLPSRGDMAYALFCFDMTYFEGPEEITLDWEDEAPAETSTFVGLGNFDRDSWDWLQPENSVVNAGSLSRYINNDLRLLLAVVVTGDQPATLNYVRIGGTCVVGDVDLTLVFPPPLAAEIQATRADWTERAPAAVNFEVLGEETGADGFLYQLVSHEVEGYKHYGSVRIPPAEAKAQFFLAVDCHPGASGCSLYQPNTFDMLTEESGLRNQFIVLAPSFRSEQLRAGEMGIYTSQAPPSLFDRDADDALAMLECVLQNYPQADDRLIVAYGLSRGAQVSTRMAERDPRIHAVAAYCGFTDEWTIDGQAYMYYNIGEISETEPDPTDFYPHVMWDLRFGSGDVFKARRSLLLTSTAPFADSLPRTQLHYGELDPYLPIRHGERLDAILTQLGTNHEFYRYPNGGHEMFLSTGGADRFQQLLTEMIAALE